MGTLFARLTYFCDFVCLCSFVLFLKAYFFKKISASKSFLVRNVHEVRERYKVAETSVEEQILHFLSRYMKIANANIV